ncbi:MAG: glutamate-5-semialdehyde dehydrogenase [Thermoleophilia bacterium]|nr:glutamate-5-semialdehyde dehydrogenase [Thermoleophilia bacterium]
MQPRKIRKLCNAAREASRRLATLTPDQKNLALAEMAEALMRRKGEIIRENRDDIKEGKAAHLSAALLDRLRLDEDRIRDMADGLRHLASLPDPVGEIVDGWHTSNGLEISRIRVPFGVIAVIFEARPNVAVDAAGLCLKAGNSAILRGGSASLRSVRILTEIISGALIDAGIPRDAVSMVESRERGDLKQLLAMSDYIDLVIPRGGEGLKDYLKKNSKIPVIYAAGGNCHTFVDASAEVEKAIRVVVNAKVQRPGVCNALETLLVHRRAAADFIPLAAAELIKRNVLLYMDEDSRALAETSVRDGSEWIEEATDEHYATEFLDLKLAVKIVDSVDEAIEHITRYGTGHSEAILTNDLENSRRFAAGVDAACVYVNASTRFTDGGEFGMGAEIGISTQKLHARGPLGLRELTSVKYVITGDGHVRG